MASGPGDPSTDQLQNSDWGQTRRVIARLGLVSIRLLGDGLILGLWVVFLVILFLSTGWPRWAFYLILVLGTIAYVVVTPQWRSSFGASEEGDLKDNPGESFEIDHNADANRTSDSDRKVGSDSKRR